MYPWGVEESFFFKVTYSPTARRLHIYNYGCNFNCTWCYYRLKTPECSRRLSLNRIIDVIDKLYNEGKLVKVHFLGGEPTINPDLPTLIGYVKRLDVTVKLFTNGYNGVPHGVDEVNVSIRLMDDVKHKRHTGKSVKPILKNIVKSYIEGVRVSVTTVYIPDFNSEDIIALAKFLSSIDGQIPLHIIGYIPVPGAPWRKPSNYEVQLLANKCRRFLEHVSWSNVSSDQIKYDSLRLL